MHIRELAEIRIIINGGAGLGHQKAGITLMLKLRQMGFEGTFDIRYIEIYPVSGASKEADAKFGTIGRVLHVLIPEFNPTPLDVKDDLGHDLVETRHGLGPIRITRLPDIDESKSHYTSLPHTILTLTAADDYGDPKQRADSPPGHFVKTPLKYNSEMYACLQPTDWNRGDRFIYLRNKNNAIPLDERLILSCETPTPSISNADLLSPAENRILAILNNSDFITQFIYITESRTSRIKPEHIIPSVLKAHLKNIQEGKYGDKPVILLCPRGQFDGCHFHDLSTLDLPNPLPSQIIWAHTGNLSPEFFDYVLHNTSFPALLQGANSISYCESKGLPFLYFCDSGMPFEYYPLKKDALEKTQIKHEYASQGALQSLYFAHLCEYLSDSINHREDIVTYHQARANQFNARGNIVEVALQKLGIEYGIGPNPRPGNDSRSCQIS